MSIVHNWMQFAHAFRQLGAQTMGMRPVAALALAVKAEDYLNGGFGSSTLPMAMSGPFSRSEALVDYPADYKYCSGFWKLNQTTVPETITITSDGVEYVKRHKAVFDLLRGP